MRFRHSLGHRLPGRKPAPKKKRRRRLRLAVRLGMLALLLLATLIVIILLTPWSLPLLDSRIQRLWTNTTGIPLAFEHARFWPIQGQIDIAQPVLIDPQTRQPLVELASLHLELDVDRLFQLRPRFQIRDILVSGPVNLDFRLQHGRLVPMPPWDRLLEILEQSGHLSGVSPETLQPESDDAWPTAATIQLHRLQFHPIGFRIFDAAADPDAPPLFGLGDATLQAVFHPDLAPQEIRLSGQLNRSPAESLQLTVFPRLGANEIDVRLALSHLDLHADLPWALPWPLTTEDLELRGRFSYGELGLWEAQGALTAGQLIARRDYPLPDHRLGPVTVDWTMGFDPNLRQLVIEDLDLRSRPLNLKGSGRVMTRAPFPYQLQVNPLQLGGDAALMLADQIERLGGTIDPDRAALTVSGLLRGDLGRPRPDSVTGGLELQGVSWDLEALPIPLRDVHVKARLTTDSLHVERLYGVYRQIPVEIDGVIAGQPLRGRINSVDLHWVTVGALQDFSLTAEPQGALGAINPASRNLPAQDLRLSGQFTGEGRLQVDQPLEGTLAEALDRSRFQGQLRINSATLGSEALPQPIRNITAQLDFSTTQTHFRRFTGSFLGLDFDAGGAIYGSTFFWRYPTLEASIRLGTPLDQLRRQLDENWPQGAQLLEPLPPLQGRADLDLILDTDLANWRQADWRARIQLQDVRTSLSLPRVNGPLHLPLVEATLDPHTLVLNETRGALGDLALNVSGSLNPTSGSANLRLAGPLQEYKDRLHPLLQDLLVGGSAQIDHQLTLQPRPEAPEPQSWADVLDRLLIPPAQHDDPPLPGRFARLWQPAGEGRIQLEDAELTYYTMPERLQHLTGLVRYDQQRLWTPQPLPVYGGEGSQDLSGTVEIIFPRAADPLRFNFAVRGNHIPLTHWITKWKPPRRPPGQPANRWGRDFETLDRSLTPFFSMRGNFQVNSASFKKLEGQDVSARLELDFWREQPGQLRWNDFVARFYDGQLRINGSMGNWMTDSRFEVENAELPRLMAALTGEQQPHGIFSGRLFGSATVHKGWAHRQTPLTGHGELRVEKSRFVANDVLHSLGGLLELPLFEDISFSTIHGPFRLDDRVVTSDQIIFDHPLMNLKMSGAFGPEHKLDFLLQVQFLKVISGVPLVGEAMDLFNRLAGQLLRFRVQGTLEQPEIIAL